ncbi:MAG TPA: hypothetical protein VN903_11970, partial [Polyangia bacterium]|nr:hypothetical protein [Polyangia bacterium]
ANNGASTRKRMTPPRGRASGKERLLDFIRRIKAQSCDDCQALLRRKTSTAENHHVVKPAHFFAEFGRFLKRRFTARVA